MTLRWSDWQTPITPEAQTASPYVAWYKATQLGAGLCSRGQTAFHLNAPDCSGLSPFDVPLPPKALPVPGVLPVVDPHYPMPRPDAVVIGIIDTALALSHERFRHCDGSTRFLAAWQQGGAWQGQALPFGHELRRPAIDALMDACSIADVLDETAFNLAAGLTSFNDPLADREIELSASHGTHVLDLAAGHDPSKPDANGLRDRQPILAVTLPPRPSIGASGGFLEFFVIHAINYIVTTADRIWAAHYSGFTGASGFPIVINLSYGLQAGPKDGQMALERYIGSVITQRINDGKSPLRIVLPAGNDNLERGHAKLTTRPAGKALTWRLRPDDQTPNYLEIYSEPAANAATLPLFLTVTPPGSAPQILTPAQPGQFCDLVEGSSPDIPLARLYCRLSQTGSFPRLRYVLCTRPTASADGPIVPAGAWQLGFAGPQIPLDLYIQSDQSLDHGAATGLLSYFDSPEYHIRDEAGRIVDSAGYPEPVPQDTGMVRRTGTLNAIASLPECLVIAGYRASDGRPAVYSSTGTGGYGPTASLPSDDGSAHFGLRAAGAKSGSTTAMQGTSFATALATRLVAEQLLRWHGAGRAADSLLGSAQWMAATAFVTDSTLGFPGTLFAPKSGKGRLAAPASDRISRMER